MEEKKLNDLVEISDDALDEVAGGLSVTNNLKPKSAAVFNTSPDNVFRKAAEEIKKATGQRNRYNDGSSGIRSV